MVECLPVDPATWVRFRAGAGKIFSLYDSRICLHNSQRGGEEKDCTRFAVIIQCHDSTGCDEMGDYFAIEADTMIDIVRVT